MIDLQTIQTLNEEKKALEGVLAGIKVRNKAWVDWLLQNKERVAQLLSAAGHEKQAKKMQEQDFNELEELFAQEQAIKTLREQVQATQDARKLADLLKSAKRYFKRGQTQIAKIELTLTTYNQERELFDKIAAQLEAARAQWDTANPLEELARVFKHMRDQLPHILEEQFADKTIAKYLRHQLTKKEIADPVLHPEPLLVVVNRIRELLAQPKTYQRRVEKVQSEALDIIKAQEQRVEKQITRAHDKLEALFSKRLLELRGAANAAAAAANNNVEIQDAVSLYLETLARKMLICSTIIAQMGQDEPNKAQALKLLEEYEDLLKRDEALEVQILQDQKLAALAEKIFEREVEKAA